MRALVNSGGGSRGAWQLGVIKKLHETETFDHYFGTSVGSLNSVGVAFLGVSETEKMWRAIKGKSDILKSNWYKLPFATGLYNSGPLRAKLEGIIKGRQPKVPVTVSYVHMKSGALIYDTMTPAGKEAALRIVVNKNDITEEKYEPDTFIDAVVASASIPFAVEPSAGSGDGGARAYLPLDEALRLGYRDITVILCSPWEKNPKLWEPKFPKFLSYGMRAIDILEHEVMVNDLRVCHHEYPDLKLKIFAPKEEMPFDTLEFVPEKIEWAIDLGMKAEPISREEVSSNG